MINPNDVEEILNNYEAELNSSLHRYQSKLEAIVEIRKRFRALVSGDGIPARENICYDCNHPAHAGVCPVRSNEGIICFCGVTDAARRAISM